jgi:hypothetical protein
LALSQFPVALLWSPNVRVTDLSGQSLPVIWVG